MRQHYDVSQWSDYVRGVFGGEQQQAMEAHLGSGCASCSRTADLLRRVKDVADSDSRNAPPDFALRSVKAYFGLQSPERVSGFGRVPVRLAYDSLLEPAPVGTRSLHSSSRQLVCYAKNYALTVRMDHLDDKEDEELILAGEVLHQLDGPMPNVPAYLMSGRQVLAQTRSGELGDFHMTCSSATPLRLCLLVDNDQVMEIGLDREPM